jgi:hypothetical protein
MTGLTPLEAKAVYVVGMVRHIVESSGWCLTHRPPLDLAAFALGCEASELLGRAVRGGSTIASHVTEDLKSGLEFLVPADMPIAGTEASFTAEDVVELRHFATHGAAATRAGGMPGLLDRALTIGLLNRVADGLVRWWRSCRNDEANARKHLAHALIEPLWTAGQVLFIADLLPIDVELFPSGTLLYDESWRAS